jgi:hypothetical protein
MEVVVSVAPHPAKIALLMSAQPALAVNILMKWIIWF